MAKDSLSRGSRPLRSHPGNLEMGLGIIPRLIREARLHPEQDISVSSRTTPPQSARGSAAHSLADRATGGGRNFVTRRIADERF